MLRLAHFPLLAATLAPGVAAAVAPRGTDSPPRSNVLVVLMDDVGVDRLRTYALDPNCGPTPTLDELVSDGVLFQNCWAMPLCSPSRATVLTGRYGFRTGIGSNLDNEQGNPELDPSEWTLPEVLAQGSDGAYRSAAIGKWHLAPGFYLGAPPPMKAGFEISSGALGNLGDDGDPGAWWDFFKAIPTGKVQVTRYATTDEVDDAARAIESFGDDPWFVYLAFHSAHAPYHAPPPDLQDRPLVGDPEDTKILHHKAMVQAMDAELGRLLSEISPAIRERTTVIVMGDNGTPEDAIEPALDPSHCKGTLYEGGVRVPLIVAGAGVRGSARGRACKALVNSTDLFATTAALCGVDARAVVPREIALDSESLLAYLQDPDRPSTRSVLYAERFKIKPNGNYHTRVRAVRGPRFKLIRDEVAHVDLLFDLELDRLEHRELLEHVTELTDDQRHAYVDLSRWLESLVER